MSKSFVVFKDPQSAAPVAWEGVWESTASPKLSAVAFYIQPWLLAQETQALIPQHETTAVADIEALLNQAWISNCDAHSTEKGDFTHLVAFIRTGIIQGDFNKIVAARQAVAPVAQSVYDIFQKAVAAYPNCFVYCLNHPEWGLWLGASPEKFVHYAEGEVHTVALAGSLFHKEATWTGKEQEEQSVTSSYIRECAQALHLEVTRTSVEEKTQGALRHLSENIRIACPPETLPQLMVALHPTPAVGGYPKAKALHFIERFEHLDRKLYSGWLGYSQEGKLNTWVNLRCANLMGDKAVLYAGCGVNAGSNPEVEWQETEAKLQIMREILS